MIENCLVKYSRECIKKPTHAVFLLHGRGCNAENMLSAFDTLCDIKNLVVFSIEPEKEWYPIPNGSSDQESAIHGLDKNLPKIREFILKTLFTGEESIPNDYYVGFDKKTNPITIKIDDLRYKNLSHRFQYLKEKHKTKIYGRC